VAGSERNGGMKWRCVQRRKGSRGSEWKRERERERERDREWANEMGTASAAADLRR